MKNRWAGRFVALMMVPALVVAIELCLRLFSYGYSTAFFVPLDENSLTTNPRFAWQYYSRKTATSPTPVIFSKEKPSGTTRIFVLGESAAAGTPDPAFSFSRMLELMLRDQYPSSRFEVINAAMRGIDSHVIRTIAAECAELSPDLFIVYAGNNEMIGLHAPSPEEFSLTSNIHWLRFKHAAARLKLVQAGRTALSSLGAKDGPKQDMEFFRRQRLAYDDARRDPVYEHYERNMRDICRFAERVGTQTLLGTVAVNLRDFPPLGSLHRPGLSGEQIAQWEKLYAEGAAAESAGKHSGALASFDRALQIDDRFAELHFRIARCHDALGHAEDARNHFERARDLDAIQFRTDGRMNTAVRSLATNAPGRIHLVDVAQELARSPLAEKGIPGKRLFHEHVHFTFDGDHQLAGVFVPAVASALKLSPPAKPLLSRDDCARALAYTRIDEVNVRTAIVRLTGNPPFLDQLEHGVRQLKANHELESQLKSITHRDTQEALATYRSAVAARPDDWMLHFNYANMLSQLKQPGEAVSHYAEVVKRLPHQHKFRVALGNALLESGQAREAQEHFKAALRVDPQFKPALDGLSFASARR